MVDIPVISSIPIIGEALFEQRWLGYLAFVVVPLVWWLESFPFLLALIGLLIFATRAKKPAALAEPFARGVD